MRVQCDLFKPVEVDDGTERKVVFEFVQRFDADFSNATLRQRAQFGALNDEVQGVIRARYIPAFAAVGATWQVLARVPGRPMRCRLSAVPQPDRYDAFVDILLFVLRADQ
jgi:hypothetical protein